jgi:adenosyl cobinamide kinase/adenosyl cobinamide phosphate guanylyltransferase
VWVIATATAGDADMAARIERHKNERPKEWVTAETALTVTSAFKEAPDNALVILDCVTMWVSNCLCNEFDVAKMEREALTLVSMVSQREAPVVIVTNEVGLGIVPENELARRYRDMLGRVNQALAQASERVLFLSAGRVTQLEKIEDLF